MNINTEDDFRRVGEFIMRNGTSLLSESIWWGIFLAVTILSMRNLYLQGYWSPPRCFLTITILAMFIMSTTIISLDIYDFLYQVKEILLRDSDQNIDAKALAAMPPLSISQSVAYALFAFEFLLGDAVVIWRTWVLFSDRHWAMIFPLALWMGSFATLIAECVCLGKMGGYSGFERDVPGNKTCRVIQNTNFALSLAANAVSTLMIIIVTWQYRSVIRACLGSSTPTKVQHILTLLIESGLIYLLFWIFRTSLTFTDFGDYGPGLIFAMHVDSISSQVVGLYPTLIIVLVAHRRTAWDGPSVTDHVSSLQFASRAQESTARTKSPAIVPPSTQRSSLRSSHDLPDPWVFTEGEEEIWRVCESRKYIKDTESSVSS